MILRFREVYPGKLYRGSAPSPKDVQELRNLLGIKKIVSLDKEYGNKIDRICHLIGIDHVKMYLEANKADLLHFLTQDFKQLFLEHAPVFVHCHWGKDRTSLACALVKIKSMSVSPQQALKEAIGLGFGVGLDPKLRNLYEKLILSCKPEKSIDSNNADIVSNEREYKGDNRDGFLDEVNRGSFAPYLDHTRQNPMDALYTYVNDQSPTRQNYPDTSLYQYNPDLGEVVPNVGEFDNDGGLRGAGPTEMMNGWFSEVGH